jgi:hypothetical protein
MVSLSSKSTLLCKLSQAFERFDELELDVEYAHTQYGRWRKNVRAMESYDPLIIFELLVGIVRKAG